jgi:hypothetical protein
MNKTCYEFVEYNFNNCLFQNIEATYIIHLKNNGRLNNVLAQLNENKITKHVFIMYNEGYKNCNKSEYINNTCTDLIDCNFTIFEHALKNNFNNILILEDDFIFNPDIKDLKIINDVETFVLNELDYNSFYYLSCVPIVRRPYKKVHSKIIIGCTTHSIIFSHDFIVNVLQNTNKKELSDWDKFLFTSGFKRYSYHKPLCYQLFPKTQNYNNWKGPPFLFNIDVFLFKFFLRINNMDKIYEPGFSNFYFYSLLFYYFLCFLFVIILIYLIYILF